jgi:hypothetical protein
MGLILLCVGFVIMIVGFIWIVVNAFKTSVLWGLGALFVPLVAQIFAIMNWATNKTAFLIWLGGLVLYIVGVVMYLPTMQAASQGMPAG